ncbi:arginase family protein [Leifsonia sp. ZF2019]|uniref:arginase family protein n=1 Tax=Leifsonia sp. ZF2019 TaxID=2781978 RepID=UPI001CBECA92|nr:arginase family protein [Leifsonia sp. ZF2019]UAJ80805.1 arginase family protein [Leifsonia sp. ZF2019]
MSAASFLVVPQWQGSGSSRAMRLIDGADAIRGDLPAGATHVVPVPSAAGDALGTGVHRFSSLTLVRELAAAELALLESPVVTVGGDCAADLASVQHAVASRPAGEVALVWFDAHGDLNNVTSSPSGAFHGMVVRALLGDGPDGLASTGAARLASSHLVLAGTRSLDDGESAFVDAAGIRAVAPGELEDPDSVVRAVEATGASAVYIHVDLDVLDPADIDGIGYPEPFGVTPTALCDAIRALRGTFELVGAGLTEFAPESPDAAGRDLPVILRILGALTGPLGTGTPSSTGARPRHLSTDPASSPDGP